MVFCLIFSVWGVFFFFFLTLLNLCTGAKDCFRSRATCFNLIYAPSGPSRKFFFSSQEERMCAQYHKHMITGRSSWYTGCRYVIKEDDIKRLRLPWRNSTFSYILLLKITCFINVDDASYTGSRIHACECMWCYIIFLQMN